MVNPCRPEYGHVKLLGVVSSQVAPVQEVPPLLCHLSKAWAAHQVILWGVWGGGALLVSMLIHEV